MLPNFHFSIERWRKNTEFGVWVSTHGRVKLLKNKEFLEPRINESGYCFIFTEKGSILIHRLVAYTWLGDKRNEKYTVDHINSNKRDNRVSNLRWVPKTINEAYARFTQCNAECLTETVPDISVEEEEKNLTKDLTPEDKIANLLSDKFSKEQRVSEFLKLLRINDIVVVYNNTDLTTYEELLQIRDKKAVGAKDISFILRILKAVKNNGKYCGGIWKIKAIKHGDENNGNL